MNYNIAVIILVILIVLFFSVYKNKKNLNSMLEGLWTAKSEFCEKAGIDGMMIFIGPEDKPRKVYVLMYANNSVIFSDCIEVTFSRFLFPFISPSKFNFSMNVNTKESETLKELFPNPIKIEVDLTSGLMYWLHKDTVHAELVKDNINT